MNKREIDKPYHPDCAADAVQHVLFIECVCGGKKPKFSTNRRLVEVHTTVELGYAEGETFEIDRVFSFFDPFTREPLFPQEFLCICEKDEKHKFGIPLSEAMTHAEEIIQEFIKGEREIHTLKELKRQHKLALIECSESVEHYGYL